MNAQNYCFFMKKHSQIVQIYSQIVQICIFSLQIAIFRYKKIPATRVTGMLSNPVSLKVQQIFGWHSGG